jgi:hypothetical protein
MIKKIINVLVIVGGLSIIITLISLFDYSHKYDTILKVECEQKGGTFVQARDPLYVCVKTIKLSK